MCRVESLLTYLLIEWLKETSVPLSTIKAIALEIENSRLNQKYSNFDRCLEEILKAHRLSKSIFFSVVTVFCDYHRQAFSYTDSILFIEELR
jgi:hypothetical protein